MKLELDSEPAKKTEPVKKQTGSARHIMGSASHKADLDPHHWNNTNLVGRRIRMHIPGLHWNSTNLVGRRGLVFSSAAGRRFWFLLASRLIYFEKRYISSVPEPGPFSLAGAEAAPTPNDNKPVLRSRIRSLWSRNYLRPGAGAEIKYLFNKYLLKSVWRMLG